MPNGYRYNGRDGMLRILILVIIFLLPLGIMIWHLLSRIVHILRPLTR